MNAHSDAEANWPGSLDTTLRSGNRAVIANVIVTEHDGTQHVVEAQIGVLVMSAVVKNGVPGILDDWGDEMACVTCQAHPSRDSYGSAGMSEIECEMLDGAAVERWEHPRLGCQVSLTDDFDNSGHDRRSGSAATGAEEQWQAMRDGLSCSRYVSYGILGIELILGKGLVNLFQADPNL